MSEWQGRRPGEASPAPSPRVALEVALLTSSEEHAIPDARVALVVSSDADERTYLSDSLRQRADLAVVVVGTIAAALESAARGTPHLLVVTHNERGVIRHLPAIPAILLTEDASAVRDAEGSRLAPIVVLRGAFRGTRLLEVVASLLGGEPGRE